jgi:hypothetical protein
VIVPLARLSGVFLVQDFAGNPGYVDARTQRAGHGRRIEVTLMDDEVIAGRTELQAGRLRVFRCPRIRSVQHPHLRRLEFRASGPVSLRIKSDPGSGSGSDGRRNVPGPAEAHMKLARVTSRNPALRFGTFIVIRRQHHPSHFGAP